MVQFMSIIFFVGFLQFLLGISKVPVFLCHSVLSGFSHTVSAASPRSLICTAHTFFTSTAQKALSETFSCFAYSWTCSRLLNVTTTETTRRQIQLEQINECAVTYLWLLRFRCRCSWHVFSHAIKINWPS